MAIYTVYVKNGWKITSPDTPTTVPSGAINENLKALANLFSAYGVDAMVPQGDYVVSVSREGSDIDRGTALKNAYVTAAAFNPTATKRATVIILPGRNGDGGR